MIDTERLSFDVLAEDLDLTSSYLLEASAGTGKTFAIEHLVTRYLLDEPRIALDQIAVVTFTRKAARQMRQRVRLNLESALRALQMGRAGEGAVDEQLPYLRARMEMGATSVAKAIAYLQDALENFDQARIGTIHSFCSKLLLQESLGSNPPLDEGETLRAVESVERHIAHWIFGEWSSKHLEAIDLAEALQALTSEPIRWSDERLIKELTEIVVCSGPLCSAPGLDHLLGELRARAALMSKETWRWVVGEPYPFKALNGEVARRQQIGLALELLLGDEPLARCISAEEIINALTALLKGRGSAKLKREFAANSTARELTDLVDKLAESYLSQLDGVRLAKAAFLRLASACQTALAPTLEAMDLLSTDQMQRRMAKRAKDPSIAAALRSATKVFIVDEFQDTDPEQWAIFEHLFLRGNQSSRVVFVGDPKQSIYAFRRADIYTYDKARKWVDETKTLAVNFRAKQSLVEGLNELMRVEHVGHWIELPKSGGYLPVRRVISHHCEPPQKRVHFLPKAETFEKLCQLAARQIAHSGTCDSLGQIAVLVDTHKNGGVVRAALDEFGIAHRSLPEQNIAHLPASQWLQSLLNMVLEPSDRTLRRALAEPILGWCDQQLLKMFDKTRVADASAWQTLARLYSQRADLRRILMKRGFTPFYFALMKSRWGREAESVAEHLIANQTPLLRGQWEQIAHRLMEIERTQSLRAHQLPRALENLESIERFTGERTFNASDSEANAVHILTLHGCKGLEFDHVFALGAAASRSNRHGFQLISFEDAAGQMQRTALETLPVSQRALHDREQEAEKARLLYVALTRAKEHLYIPLPLEHSSRGGKKRGIAPLEWFLARFDVPSGNREELQTRALKGSFEPFYTWLSQQTRDSNSCIDWLEESRLSRQKAADPFGDCKSSSATALESTPSIRVAEQSWMHSPEQLAVHSAEQLAVHSAERQMVSQTAPPILQPFRCSSAPYERTSFSAWAAKLKLHRDPDEEFDQALASEQETTTLPLHTALPKGELPEQAAKIPGLCWHLLPRGPAVGGILHELLHQVLQNRALLVPDNRAGFAKLTEQLDAELKVFPLAKMLSEVFDSSLEIPGQNTSLNDILAEHCRSEVEFLLSQEVDRGVIEPFRGIFWNGFIDLVFEHENRFYLLDWKSNYLGETDEAYTAKAIEAEIERCSYLAQAQLYSDALKRHLSLSGRSADFGGFIFYFLRGRKAHFLPHRTLSPPFFVDLRRSERGARDWT